MMEFVVGSVIRQKCDRCLEAGQVCYIQRNSHRPRNDHEEVSQVRL